MSLNFGNNAVHATNNSGWSELSLISSYTTNSGAIGGFLSLRSNSDGIPNLNDKQFNLSLDDRDCCRGANFFTNSNKAQGKEIQTLKVLLQQTLAGLGTLQKKVNHMEVVNEQSLLRQAAY